MLSNDEVEEGSRIFALLLSGAPGAMDEWDASPIAIREAIFKALIKATTPVGESKRATQPVTPYDSLSLDERASAAQLWTTLVSFEPDAFEQLEQAPPRIQKAVRVAIVEAVQQAILQGGNPKRNENPFTSAS